MTFQDRYKEFANNKKLYSDLEFILTGLYNEEQSHTIVFMPFFGLIHIYGNQLQPILDFGTMMTLRLMNENFKQVHVYRGETEVLYRCDSIAKDYDSPERMEILVRKQWIFNNILNEAIPYLPFTDDYSDKVNLFENEHTNGKFKLHDNSSFNQLIDEYPLPFKTAFDLQNEDDFIDYIDRTLRKAQKEDKFAKVLLIYPTYFLEDEKQLKSFKKIEEYIKSINGNIYYASNYSGNFIRRDYYNYKPCHDYKHVCSLQHFSKTYCEDIYEQMLEILIENLSPEDIKNSVFGPNGEKIDDVSVSDLYTKTKTRKNITKF